MPRFRFRLAMLLAGALVLATLAGCGFLNAKETDTGTGTAPASLRVSSTAFRDGSAIPREFSCKGANISPPLRWSGVSPDARSLALVVDDPDAPNGTFTHWVVFNIDPADTAVPADAVPAGASQAKNSGNHASYDGPCPPSGTHHYRFTVYVLRSPLTVPGGGDKDRVLAAIKAKAIAKGTLTGTFSTS